MCSDFGQPIICVENNFEGIQNYNCLGTPEYLIQHWVHAIKNLRSSDLQMKPSKYCHISWLHATTTTTTITSGLSSRRKIVRRTLSINTYEFRIRQRFHDGFAKLAQSLKYIKKKVLFFYFFFFLRSICPRLRRTVRLRYGPPIRRR